MLMVEMMLEWTKRRPACLGEGRRSGSGSGSLDRVLRDCLTRLDCLDDLLLARCITGQERSVLDPVVVE